LWSAHLVLFCLPLYEIMSEDSLDPEDELKAENELLKLKLELEQGMQHSDTTALSPEAETQWLNYIYNYEKMYKDAGTVKIYDFIGRPGFKIMDTLDAGQMSKELEKLFAVMEEKGICIDFAVAYDEAVIYRFITEEFFNHEMENISLEGMTHHFSYEEFHPNHDYDLRRYAEEFIENVIEKEWSRKFNTATLCDEISFQNKRLGSDEISTIIETFQQAHSELKLNSFETGRVDFNEEEGNATVQATVEYETILSGEKRGYSGECIIQFSYQWGYWYISGFQLPGLG